MKSILISVILHGFVASAVAQSASDILIGVSLPLSGPGAAAGKEGQAVMQAYIDSVNKAGGIQGKRIVLRVLDDEFNPQKAADNARQLANDKVVALFNCWGTSSCSAMLPVASEYSVPLIAGIAGSGPMRTQPGHFVFNVRPTTSAEIARMVEQMVVGGQTRIAVVYQKDAFGQSALAAAQEVLAKAGIKPTGEVALSADASDVPVVLEALKKGAPNGVVLLASSRSTVALITQARRSGLAVPIYNLAAQANQRVATDLGEYTGNVIFTTVVPSPARVALPVVNEYRKLYAAVSGSDEFSYLGLETFINTRILVEGLRHAGRDQSREGLVTALETMGAKTFGDVVSVKYGPNRRDGSSFVGLAIVDRQGRFRE